MCRLWHLLTSGGGSRKSKWRKKVQMKKNKDKWQETGNKQN